LVTPQNVALVGLLICWILWVFPFFRARQQGTQEAVVIAPAARWGLGFQMLGFGLVWVLHGSANPLGCLAAGMLIAPFSVWLAWRSVLHLGKQWRIQAGLNADHELIRSGPYSIVRHPIYLSMFGMLLSTGLVLGRWPLLIAGAVLFLIGAEIRTRVEDALLRSRFGEAFNQYQASVPAYLPFIR
jgi:protein-S-isoprenylcysteine O-methyltransferase Ste14